MPRTNFQELLDAGVHFGHLARKWNPKMAPYIFDQKNGIHIIDLHKSIVKIDEAANVLKQFARSGRKVLFVATKKQAKEIVAEKAGSVNMPYVTERWPGGMLTNFPTIRKAVKKMNTIDKMIEDGTFDTLAKRERLQVTRQRAKLEKNLGSIKDLSRLPSALFVVDVQKEMNAVKEANRLNIPVIAMVDTCCDPDFAEQLIHDADVIFCLDFNEPKRIEKLAPAVIASEGRKVMIDHHLNPTDFCRVTMSYPEMSSTSEMIFRFICRMGMFDLMSKEAAVCIYTGMMTDTGSFTYNSNKPEIYTIVSELIKKGIDKDLIYRKVFQVYSESRLRMQGFRHFSSRQVDVSHFP